LKAPAARHDSRTLCRFTPAKHDVFPRLNAALDFDIAAMRDRVFNHHHGVRTLGHGSASHDRDALAGAHLTLKRSARRHFAHAPKHGREGGEITSTHGIPIANGAMKRGQVAVRGDVLCQSPAERQV